MITYVDTSVLVKLLVVDERGADAAQRVWMSSDTIVCVEIGYVEARAALAAIQRNGRLSRRALGTAKAELDELWSQVWAVPLTADLVSAAGDLAETDSLRGYDAVHLAAAIAAKVDLVAAADGQLVQAAQRRRFAVADTNG